MLNQLPRVFNSSSDNGEFFNLGFFRWMKDNKLTKRSGYKTIKTQDGREIEAGLYWNTVVLQDMISLCKKMSFGNVFEYPDYASEYDEKFHPDYPREIYQMWPEKFVEFVKSKQGFASK